LKRALVVFSGLILACWGGNWIPSSFLSGFANSPRLVLAGDLQGDGDIGDVQALPDPPSPDIGDTRAIPDQLPEPGEGMIDLKRYPLAYTGTWVRIGTYVNGEAQNTSDATLTLKKDSYISTAGCTAEGDLHVAGNEMTMTVTHSDCPAVTMPAYTFSCQVSKDVRTMWLTTRMMGAEVKEIYSRTGELPERDIGDIQALPDNLPEEDIGNVQAIPDVPPADIGDVQAIPDELPPDIGDRQALPNELPQDIGDVQALPDELPGSSD